MKNTTLGSVISTLHERPPTSAAVRFKEQGVWQEWTWSEYQAKIISTAAALFELGFQPADKVAICSNTRPEWALLDLAILGSHGVTIPIYPNNTAEEIQFILNHSEATILFVESKNHLKIWSQISKSCPKIKKVIGIDSAIEDTANSLSWKSFYARAEKNSGTHDEQFKKLLLTLKLSDTASLVYTSGTTGEPKAVVLSHEQIVSEVSEAFPMCGANAGDTSLTFLPFAHVFGRIEIWGHAFIGYTMAYAESIEKIRGDLVEIKPTFMMAVPRIFEKIYSAIFSQLETSPVSRKLFDWALAVGLKISDKKLNRQNLPLALVLEYELAQRLVLHKVKDAFGGRIRFVVSGGAPINHDISQFFHAAGILILEGYGLTETTAAICVNTPFNYHFGSVGRPIGDVKLKIADDGEILVQSKKIMKSYYKDPAATAEVLQDGWFHTGDIGEILHSGDLKITDRKKDLIKTAGGKYVAPQKLEGLLKLNPMIAHALIHGDQKKFIVALVTLNQDYLLKYAKDHGISFQIWTDLIGKTEITDLIRKAVSEANSQLASYETIKKFAILPVDFSIEGGELTPSLKVKRKVLDARFASQIQALYD